MLAACQRRKLRAHARQPHLPVAVQIRKPRKTKRVHSGASCLVSSLNTCAGSASQANMRLHGRARRLLPRADRLQHIASQLPYYPQDAWQWQWPQSAVTWTGCRTAVSLEEGSRLGGYLRAGHSCSSFKPGSRRTSPGEGAAGGGRCSGSPLATELEPIKPARSSSCWTPRLYSWRGTRANADKCSRP